MHFTSFQYPPTENRCHVAIAKRSISGDDKIETNLIKHSAIVAADSEFVFAASGIVDEEVYSIFFHTDYIYVGVVGRVLVFDPQLKSKLEIPLQLDYLSNIPFVNALYFESGMLCVGCSDASVQFFSLDDNGFNHKHSLIAPSSIIPNSFNYSDGSLYFATVAGYVGIVQLLGFIVEYIPTYVDICALGVYSEQLYIATRENNILVFKKNSAYEINEQIHTGITDERIVSLFIAYPFIYFLTDKGVCHKCDPTSSNVNGSFTIKKMEKEYSVASQLTELQQQENSPFCIECIGAVQAVNCFAAVIVNEYGDISGTVNLLE